jgi:hypothetical protein
MKPDISNLMTWFPLKHSIERFYPFTSDDLQECEKFLDFCNLSFNRKIVWNENILREHSHELCWSAITTNPSVPWDAKLVHTFENYITWQEAANCQNFPWTRELFFKYKDFLDWDNLYEMPVKLQQADFYRFNSEQLSHLIRFQNIPWTVGLIESYQYDFNWELLGDNTGLPYSENFFKTFHQHFSYSRVLGHPWLLRDENLAILERIAFIEYNLLSQYKEDWTDEFIERHKHFLNWDLLSANMNLPWSKDFLYRYEHKWNWFEMSGNTNVPWTWELIEKYEEEWNWQVDDDPYISMFGTMSSNPSLPWSRKFVERFGHHIGFGSVEQVGENEFALLFGISSNRKIDWDIDFLLKYKDRWDIEALGNNEAVYNTIEKMVSMEKMLDLFKAIA